MDAIAATIDALRGAAEGTLAAAAREREAALLTAQENMMMQQLHAQKAGKAAPAPKKHDTMDQAGNALLDDADDEEAAETREAARYKQYKPQQLQIGKPHPDLIVESAALAAVKQPRIYTDYSSLVEDVHEGRISDAQLETVAYSMQRFYGECLECGARGGFFLGDGAGVGKGRQIAAVIKAMWLSRDHRTRRILWLSHNKDLREDARRDMVDLHINVPSAQRVSAVQRPRIDVWPKGNSSVPQGCGKIATHLKEGVFFATYDLLKAGTGGIGKQCANIRGKNKEAESYEAMTQALSANKARCKMIMDWLNEDPDSVPLIVLDECHKAKNLINDNGVPTLCGVAVQFLQAQCPNAAVLYSSATGISEPNNMAYMTRVGTCGYPDMPALIKQLTLAGLGASELFSCTLKSNGVYLARQLSYEGAEFQLDMIDLDPRFQVQYARAAATWQAFNLFWHRPEVFGKGVSESGKVSRGIASLFWGAQLRFFRAMLMAAKVPALAREAREAIQGDYAVVIGLQSTGEANQRAEVEAHGESMDKLFSAPTTQLTKLVDALTNAPALDAGPGRIMQALTESVAMMVCLGDVLLRGGTVAKEAETLKSQLKAAAEKAAAARAKRAAAKHAEKEARAAARGSGSQAEGLDLEDSDVESGDEGDEATEAAAARGGLPCPSLSKIMLDFTREHEGEEGDGGMWASALRSLEEGAMSYGDMHSWGATQEKLERALIDLHGKLRAEQRQRERDRRAVHDLEVRRLATQAVEDAQAEFDAAKAERDAFEASVKREAGQAAPKLAEPAVSIASGTTAGSAATSTKLRAAAKGLEDASDDEEDEPPIDIDTSDSEPEDFASSPAPAGPRRRSARASAARRQVIVDSDDEDAAMEGSADEGAASRATDALEWPQGTRRHRSRSGSRSRSSAAHSHDGGSPEPGDRTSEMASPLQWRGRKRGSAEMQSPGAGRAQRLRAARRLHLDYEAAAAAEGLTVGEVARIAALERVPEDSPEALADAACQVCESKEDADTMLLCDFCQGGIHMACHSPPLSEIPAGDCDWFCPKCAPDAPKHDAAKRLQEAHVSAQARAGVSDADMQAALAAMLAGESLEGDGGEEGAGSAKVARALDTVPEAADPEDVEMAGEPEQDAKAKPVAEEKPKNAIIQKVTKAKSKPDAAADLAAATQGGAISASAALGLVKKKKKKKGGDKCAEAGPSHAPPSAAAAVVEDEESEEEEDAQAKPAAEETEGGEKPKNGVIQKVTKAKSKPDAAADMAAATQGGAISASAALGLVKKKKKKGGDKGAAAAAAAPPPATAPLDEAGPSNAPPPAPAAAPAAAAMVEDEESEEEEVYREGTIRTTQRRRHLQLCLDKKARALREAKQSAKVSKRARTSASGASGDADEGEGDSDGEDGAGPSSGSRGRRLSARRAASGGSSRRSGGSSKRGRSPAGSDSDFSAGGDGGASDDDDGSDVDAGELEASGDEAFSEEEEEEDDDDAMDVDGQPAGPPALWRRQKLELSAQPYDYEEKMFDPSGRKEIRPPHPVVMMLKRVIALVIELLELPPNPLDDLVHRCGGRKVVAELTGRQDMMEMQADGSFQQVKRAEKGVTKQGEVNMKEKQAFMEGKKLIAIISDAASTGISLQADKKCRNQRRRIHMTLELPWSADKAIQQFGRSHRSNQASAPVYKILMTRMSGEYRFAASAAKRMMSLGALLKGNRDALGAGQSLKAFDVDNEWGAKGLRQFWKELRGVKQLAGDVDPKTGKIVPTIAVPQVPEYLECRDTLPPGSVFDKYDERTRTYFNAVRTWLVQDGAIERLALYPSEKEDKIPGRTPSVFMNKFLMLNGDQQFLIFQYFQACIDAQVALAKSKGLYTTGVHFVGELGHQLSKDVVWKHPQASKGEVYLTKVQIEMGLDHAAALNLIDSNIAMMDEYGSRMKQTEVGFYVRREPKDQLGTGDDFICLVTGTMKQGNDGQAYTNDKAVLVRHPWSRNATKGHLAHIKTQWKKCNNEKAAKRLWERWYKFLNTRCGHNQPCKDAEKHGSCGFRCRKKQIDILHGSLLPCWQTLLDTTIACNTRRIEHEDDAGNVTIESKGKKAGVRGDMIQMVCIKLENGETITGMSVRKGTLSATRAALRHHQDALEDEMKRKGIAAAEAAPEPGAAAAADAHALAAAAIGELAPAASGASTSTGPLQPVKAEKKKKKRAKLAIVQGARTASPNSIENQTPGAVQAKAEPSASLPDVKPPVAAAAASGGRAGSAEGKARVSLMTDDGLMSADSLAKVKARKAARRAASQGGGTQ